MFLTGFLGNRYLWCDRVCIVQDDGASKISQIQAMAEIYARSYCTIIALDNHNADSGLHGLPNLTSKAEVWDEEKGHSHWNTRAWTFQEELFSVRVIRLS